MTKPQRRIDEITIDVPCPIPWESMTGSNKIRFCDVCQLNVYNLSYFTESEIENFIDDKVGLRKCVSLLKRPDGTIVTDRCPAALRKFRDKGLVLWQTVASLIALLFSVTQGLAQSTQPRSKMDLRVQPDHTLNVDQSTQASIPSEEWAAAFADLKAGRFAEARLKFSQLSSRDASMRADYFVGLCQKAEKSYDVARHTLTRVSALAPDVTLRQKAFVALDSLKKEAERVTPKGNEPVFMGGNVSTTVYARVENEQSKFSIEVPILRIKCDESSADSSK